MPSFSREPFGEVCFEQEIETYKEEYSSLFFQHTPFNAVALEPQCYLIVGRRGSGKSSLAHYFTFQNHIPTARCIDVDEPEAYENVLSQLSTLAMRGLPARISQVVKIWEHALWQLIFEEYRHESRIIRAACVGGDREASPSGLVKKVLRRLLSKFLEDDNDDVADDIEQLLTARSILDAQAEVQKLAKDNPVIVAMDSLEKYSTEDEGLLNATAGLIECSSKFNTKHAKHGIHVKTFLSAEIFPFLAESVVSNTSKYIRYPLKLQWRPKDLMRLVAWRFDTFLRTHGSHAEALDQPLDWSNHVEVREKAWDPYFGRTIVNGRKREERTFPYVLRHTQLRPRQMVILCNSIAREAVRNRCFPKFDSKSVVEGVREAELDLATEVINSYQKVYPKAEIIVRAITKFPMIFKASELDRVAPTTKGDWPPGEYSRYKFKKLLTELGIVGRVRQIDRSREYVEADFQYAMEDSLHIRESDDCVVHPMFFRKLSIERSDSLVIFPFPDHPSFSDVFD